MISLALRPFANSTVHPLEMLPNKINSVMIFYLPVGDAANLLI